MIARWENDGPGSPRRPAGARRALVLHGGEGHPGGWRPFDRSLGPVATGQWVDVALRVHFSANPDKAHISAWRDGERVLSEHHPPGGTLYPGQQSYLKVGLHRDAAISHPSAVHFRDLQVVQSRAAAHSERPSVDSAAADLELVGPEAPGRGTRIDRARVDAAWVDAARVDAARVDAARVDAARVDAARVDAARVGFARIGAA